MALKFGDLIKETSTTTGTGAYTLAGAVSGFRTFGSEVSDADTCYYAATMGTDYEIGLGTYTASGTTLARTTVLESSNSGSAVSWGAGTKTIILVAPAAFLASRSNVSVLLNHATSTDIANGSSMSANTWYDITTSQNITVTAGRTVQAQIGGAITVYNGYAYGQSFAIRLYVNSTGYPCGGAVLAASEYASPMSGTVPVVVTGLAAGTHTIKGQVLCFEGSGTLYVRSSTYPDTETVRVVVKEFGL